MGHWADRQEAQSIDNVRERHFQSRRKERKFRRMRELEQNICVSIRFDMEAEQAYRRPA